MSRVNNATSNYTWWKATDVLISLVTKHDKWPFRRELPSHLSKYFVFGKHDQADFVVVYDGLSNPLRISVPTSRTLVVLPEPPAVKAYDSRFLSQFGHVLTVDSRIRHPGRMLGWPIINWHYGARVSNFGMEASLQSFEDIVTDSDGSRHQKAHLASIVVSDKAFTKGQRFRLEFTEHLSRILGNDLHVFGRERNPISDKRDAIRPYKYHFALENDCVPHYFTEKLLDSFLGFAIPIYRGAPNIRDYFSPECMLQIPEELSARRAAEWSVATMAKTDYRTLEARLVEARNATLTTFNFFEAVFRIAHMVGREAQEKNGGANFIFPEERALSVRVRSMPRRLVRWAVWNRLAVRKRSSAGWNPMFHKQSRS